MFELHSQAKLVTATTKMECENVVNTEEVQTRKKKRRKKKKENTEESVTEDTEESIPLRTKKKSPRRKSPRSKESTESENKKRRRHSRRKQKTIRWKHLPVEVQAEIFSYFSIQELKSITLVCKKWKEMYYKYTSIVNLRENFTRIKCSSLSGLKILEILSKFQNIQNLSLNSCVQLPNNVLKMICHKFQNSLSALHLNECSLISDASISYICALPLLKEISLSSCPAISTHGFSVILTTLQSQLEKIDFSFNKQVNDEVLNNLNDMNLLKTLDITCTETRGKFFSYATITIEELYLNSCNHLRLHSFIGYLEYFKNIRVLDFSYYSPSDSIHMISVDDSSSEDDQVQFDCVNDVIPFIYEHLLNLEVLVLRGNVLSCQSILEIGKMPKLRVLDLVACHGFALDTLCTLSECTTLQYLDVTNCPHLNNSEAIEYILLYFGHLKLVYLPTGQFFKDWCPPANRNPFSDDFDDSFDSDEISSSFDDFGGSAYYGHHLVRAARPSHAFKTEGVLENLYSHSGMSDSHSMLDDLDDSYNF